MRLCHVLLATAVALFSSNEGFVTALSTDTHQNDDNDAAYTKQGVLTDTDPFEDEVAKVPGLPSKKKHLPVDPSTSESSDDGSEMDEVTKAPRAPKHPAAKKKVLPVDLSDDGSESDDIYESAKEDFDSDDGSESDDIYESAKEDFDSDDGSESDDVYESADSGLLSNLSEDDLGLKDLFSSGSGLENLFSLSGSDMDALLKAFGGGKLDKLVGSYDGLDGLLASLDASATGSDDADEKPAPRKTKKKAKALLYDSSEPGSDDGSDMSDLLKSLIGQSSASDGDFDDLLKDLMGSGGDLGNLLKSKTDSSLEESNDGDAGSDFDDFLKTIMSSGSIPSDLLKESSGTDFSGDIPAKAPKKMMKKASLVEEDASDSGASEDDDYWDALMSLSGSDLLSPGLTDKLDEAESALGSDNPASAPAPAPANTEAAINPNCEGWFTSVKSWWSTTFSDGSKACPSERRLRVV